MSTRPTVATDRHRTASIAAVWLATAGFCLALLAAPALATVSYPNEKEISAAGQDAGLPQVAIDGFDRATISWIRSDGSNDRVQSVRVGADGTPEAVKNLSASGEDAQSQRIAIDSSGRPTVIWARSDGSHNRIQSVRIGSNGTPEAVKTLSAAGQNAYSPEIAIDSADRATIVWARFDGSNRRIQSVRIGADGTPEAVKTLSEAGEKADDAAVAIDNSGRPTVTWERSNGSHNLIQSVRIGTDGTPEAVKTLSEAGQNAFFPEMVIDNAGRATIVWRRYDGSDIRIQSVRIGTDGTPEAVRNLSEAGESGDRVRIAIDVSDRPTVIWQRYDGLNFRIQSVRLGADGVPGTIQTVSEPDRDASRNQLAVDGSGRVTIAWDHNDFPKSVQAVRLATNGTPGPIKTLSDDSFSPQLAIDGSDRATIAWQNTGGTDDRIEATRAEIVHPGTTIISGSEGPGNESSPSFGFSSETPDATFECSLDFEPFSSCVSEEQYFDLPDGPHVFAVRAVDVESDLDLTPAERSFTVETIPPDIIPPDTAVSGSASADRKQTQKGSRIVVKAKVKAKEDLTAKGTGTVKIKRKSYKLKPKMVEVVAGKSKTLKLKPKRSKDSKKIAKALKKGKKAKAKLTVKLTDGVGNVVTEKLGVKLKR